MPYFTASEVRRYAGSTSTYRASEVLKHAQSDSGTFDIFLSHSSMDAQLIYGIRALLQSQGSTVYVDWIDDPQLSRHHVTAATADTLCRRMRSCQTLVYATSRASAASKWMPWELGYFDGVKGRTRVLIMPIEDGASGALAGAEYLGLYQTIEKGLTGNPLGVSVKRFGGGSSPLSSYARRA